MQTLVIAGPAQSAETRQSIILGRVMDARVKPGHGEANDWETSMPTPPLPRDRVDYSAIVDRPPLKLPGGARIIFWSIVNLEVWDIGKPMARQVLPAPTGQP